MASCMIKQNKNKIHNNQINDEARSAKKLT